MNHEWMDKIGNEDCGGATSSNSEILNEAVLATLHGLISIVNGNDGDGNRRRSRAFERLRLDSCSGKTWCFVLPVDVTSVLSKLKVSGGLLRNRGSDEMSCANQKLDDKREGGRLNRESLAPPPPMKTQQLKTHASPPLPPDLPGKGSAPPPMGANKHMLPGRARPLYVKECMEGSAPAVWLTGKVPKLQLGGGRKGMADTISEMKKSAYHQQIKSDVETYRKVVVALKDSINTFTTADMVELLKFHRFAESCLVKLTDESQVSARFEGFPTSKLEVIRSMAALYSKNWKVSSPPDALLDRTRQYFDKMKREIEAIEHRKDKDSKLFERNQIKFDFGILTRIKEAAVDVCSGCMELALKEGDESKSVEDKGGGDVLTL